MHFCITVDPQYSNFIIIYRDHRSILFNVDKQRVNSHSPELIKLREKVTSDQISYIRENLHQKEVLSMSDMEELLQPYNLNPMLAQWTKLLSILSNKNNVDGIEMLIKVLEAEAGPKNLFGDIAKEIRTKHCSGKLSKIRVSVS